MPQQQTKLNKLYNKMNDTMRQVGVLVKPDGTVLSHYVDSELFSKASRIHPEWLCGIYDRNVLPEHLADDINYMNGDLS